MISVDTKKKELVGPYKNNGRAWRAKERAIPYLTDSRHAASGAGSTAREDNEFRQILIFPPATEPAEGRTRRDSQGILVFPFRTTPRRSRGGRRGRATRSR